MTASMPVGGRGNGSPIFSNILRLGTLFWVKFQKNEYFLGYEESVDISWWVITK